LLVPRSPDGACACGDHLWVTVGPHTMLLSPEDAGLLAERQWYLSVLNQRRKYVRIQARFGDRYVTFAAAVVRAAAPLQADHRGRDPLDNRRPRLREATKRDNLRNRRGFGSSGAKGVERQTHTKTNPFRARIWVDGKNLNLGSFPTVEQAAAAYDAAARRLHGEFACTNDSGGAPPRRKVDA
jgi:hypothetical protein